MIAWASEVERRGEEAEPNLAIKSRYKARMLWCIRLLLIAAMILVGSVSQAGMSGRFETLIERDNRQFQSRGGLEERLDMLYDNPVMGLRSGLTLGFFQGGNEHEETLYQFYVEKTLDKKGSLLSIGRLQRSDALGFYTLDGLLFQQMADIASLTLYAGVPGRIEAFRSVDGEALYGAEVQTFARRYGVYEMRGRIGWQRLIQDHVVDRLNVGWRGIQQQTITGFLPTAFSITGNYLVDEYHWESVQFNAYKDFETDSRLRMSYDRYEMGVDELTFKDRFYSLYARGRQSQLKTAYQFSHGTQHEWSVSGRRVVREFGGSGHGVLATMEYRDDQGWRLMAQFDRLALAEERAVGFYLEVSKPFSSTLRATFGGVLQQQQKRLVGGNRAVGAEVRLERLVRVKVLPSSMQFSVQANYIDNSRLVNEYRVVLRLSYHFDDRMREMLQ
ncbi:MAG: hypothetical protein GXP08_06715 [Gammaproteobacteria bacterium]|nr:hypothetical protein [Gammaproteobacteria bacterium]